MLIDKTVPAEKQIFNDYKSAALEVVKKNNSSIKSRTESSVDTNEEEEDEEQRAKIILDGASKKSHLKKGHLFAP